MACLTTAPASLCAQESITSDRPGIGSGSGVVAAGVLQLESGLQYTSTSSDHVYSFGQVLVRYGIPGLELELFGNSYVFTLSDIRSSELDTDGLEDLGFGFKLPLVAREGIALSLQSVLTVPTGSAAVTADSWSPAFNLLADAPLGAQAGVTLNAGYSVGTNGMNDVLSLIVTPGVSLGEGVGAYAGWAGSFSSGADVHFGEAGLTFAPSPDVQLDVNGGWSLAGDFDGTEWFFGGGVAIRRIG